MKKNFNRWITFLPYAVLVVLFLTGALTTLEQSNSGSVRYVATENGAGSIDTSFTPPISCEIVAVYFHTSVDGGSGDFIMARDSDTSTTYDFVHLTVDMTSETDVGFPTNAPRIFLTPDDVMDFSWTSPITTTTWGLEIHYERR